MDQIAVRPLGALGGAPPPAPEWFTQALAAPCRDHVVPVRGANIEARSWGDATKPGLLLLHGNSAHLGWWSFLAPLFLPDYHVVTFSFGGMGQSQWRPDGYNTDIFAEEALAVIEATGLDRAAVAPIAIGHSMGGVPVLKLASMASPVIRAGMLIDTALPGPELNVPAIDRGPRRSNDGFDSMEAGLARFRLSPPQPVANLYIMDHWGRMGLAPRPDEGGRQRWHWRFDPALWDRLTKTDPWLDLAGSRVPLAILRGELSGISGGAMLERMRRTAPAGTAFVDIPQAYHHVMLDQPLALVCALRALLAASYADGWRGA